MVCSKRVFPNDRWITENEIRIYFPGERTTRIVVEEVSPGRVDATLWVNGCPVESHGDSTGTLSTRSLVEPLLRKFDEARHDSQEAR